MLLAEVARDTTVLFPSTAGATTGGSVHTDSPVYVVKPSAAVIRVHARQGRFGRVYRIGLIDTRAYRLVGWDCSNATEWLQALPPRPVATALDLWQIVVALARALNDVGDTVRVVDPPGGTALSAEYRTQTVPAVAGVVLPSLSTDTVGNWQGHATILFSNVGYHGFDLVRWDFVITQGGRIVYLREQSLITEGRRRARTLLNTP